MGGKGRILMATMGLDIGGAETHIVELVRELVRQGYDVAVASNGGVYVPELERVGVRHYQVPMNRRALVPMAKALVALCKAIRAERPDVVHAHARIPSFLCGLLRPLLRFPFVTTAHWVFQVTPATRLLTNWGQRTVAVSEDIRQYLMDNYNLPSGQISVTINGIDTEKFSPAVSGEKITGEFGLDPEAPVLAYVSRMDESRALVARQLIELAPRLSEAVPGVQLLLAGGGDVLKELSRMAAQVNAGLGRRCVIMTGPRTDINEIVAAGQVFVGVSRAALEAMAAAKPVIVAGNEGYIGLFTPDKLALSQESNFCCRGCPAPDKERLFRDVVDALTASGEEREAWGAYGRQVIQEHYSVRRMALDSVAAYEAVWKVKSRRRVLLSGYYGYNNLGDEAILRSIRQRLCQIDPAMELTVLSGNPQATEEQYGIRAVSRFSPVEIWRAVRRCDLLLSGGGSLLQDATSTRSLLYYLGVIALACRMGKPVMLYANGIGPITRPFNRRITRRVVDKVDVVTLRERRSLEELQAVGVSRPEMAVTSDSVFTLSPCGEEEARAVLARAGVPEGRPIVGISIRGAKGLEEAQEALAQFCDRAAGELGAAVVFLEMQLPTDRTVSDGIRQRMREPSYSLATPYAPETMMGAIGRMDAVLCMRLHTLIFTAKMRVPLAGIEYDPKVSSYLEELGMPSCGSPAEFDCDRAMAVLTELMENGAEYRARLEEKVSAHEAMSLENENCLLRLLNGERP